MSHFHFIPPILGEGTPRSGGGGVPSSTRKHWSHFDFFKHAVNNAVHVLIDLIIPKAQNQKTLRRKILVPRRIGSKARRLAMLRPVNFNDNAPFQFRKIDNVTADWNLPSKMETISRQIA